MAGLVDVYVRGSTLPGLVLVVAGAGEDASEASARSRRRRRAEGEPPLNVVEKVLTRRGADNCVLSRLMLYSGASVDA